MADLTLNPVDVVVATARRRGMKLAGDLVLALSDEGAPREPEPKHGVHMTETGFVRVQPGAEVDTVEVGYKAFWAVFMEEDLTAHHPNGGHAKFLSGGLLEGAAAGFDLVAEAIRESLQ
jgi:hypothetical protein